MNWQEPLCRLFLKEQWLYLDLESKLKVLGKAQSGQIKGKFKLFCRKSILDQYFFYTTTSNYDTCDSDLTVTVKPIDWENLSSDVLKKEDTFICIMHFDVLTFDEILSKFITRKMHSKARLSDNKFEELKRVYNNHREKLVLQKSDEMNIADFAILGVDSQEVLKESLIRLGLA